ncbi:cell division regulator GpsB [Jeotgalibacillus haloalkalitolerans]|uniref:Cell division regulator GpsB n=1 Tax=Jeotgalibacillus haloalkalitolerans TaxID=3104292 RepID=A0ABU5KLX9_9BACL|nr:cell division regulator GpsB [Jeotgalibacillus sp. HH7-29]MDZ5711971.1 cell division regulator GpsB [Jeotgalibacillus sp. HH7-29]
MKNDVAQLTAKEILEREFKTAMRGYKPEEVDAFLDQIIKDYEAFAERIETLENELKRAQKSPEPQRRSTVQQTQPQTTASGTTNFDILKRLSNLEKEVFGRKLYEDR